MEIKLHPNGWHRRLQRYVFGERVPLFHNFCPYFWITNFCILVTFIIPVIPFIKLIMLVCGGLSWCFNRAADYFEDSICKPLFESKALNMNPDELLKSWFYYDTHDINYREWDQIKHDNLSFWKYDYKFGDDWYASSSKKREERVKKFEIWKAKTPNWEQVLKEYQDKKRANHEQHLKDLATKRAEVLAAEAKDTQRKANAEKRRQQMFQFVIKYTKWIIYPILAAVAAFILYWLYKGVSAVIVYTIAHFYWDRFVTVSQWTGSILLCAGALFGFIYLLAKIFSRMTCSFCFSIKGTWLCKAMSVIGRSIMWFFNTIGAFFQFFWSGVMIFKKNYCPGINWEEGKNH